MGTQKHSMTIILSLVIYGVLVCACYTALAEGPLRVCPENPCYFSDDSGKAILLTGSHVWYNLLDMGPSDPPEAFDYPVYLNWMKKHNHNFMRMWTWELTTWDTHGNSPKHRNERTFHYVNLQPWKRTGPGKALDGKPKFDLTVFNPAYFDRLRSRVIQAGKQGIYVSVMLFEGWGLQRIENALKAHPFHKDNNINGINGDRNGDGKGVEIHELVNPKVTSLQETYVKKVIDTVNDLDNVLYEISNENHPKSTEWQYHIIDFIHQYEKTKPKQHPVGMTFQFKGGKNQTLFDSPADWISPNPEGGYRDNPPANDGHKVILTDTDHLWGIGGNRAWVWKSFCRGLNPIFMDPYDGVVLGKAFDPQWEPIRKSMGYVRQVADRFDITSMTPHNELASTGYCLAEPGKKYIVYMPNGKTVTVDLTGIQQRLGVRWFNPKTGKTQPSKPIQGGSPKTWEIPWKGQDAVLLLRVRNP